MTKKVWKATMLWEPEVTSSYFLFLLDQLSGIQRYLTDSDIKKEGTQHLLHFKIKQLILWYFGKICNFIDSAVLHVGLNTSKKSS